MKILIIGKGGREHAMLKACKKSKLVDKIYVLPGNCKMDGATRVDIEKWFKAFRAYEICNKNRIK